MLTEINNPESSDELKHVMSSLYGEQVSMQERIDSTSASKKAFIYL